VPVAVPPPEPPIFDPIVLLLPPPSPQPAKVAAKASSVPKRPNRLIKTPHPKSYRRDSPSSRLCQERSVELMNGLYLGGHIYDLVNHSRGSGE